MAEKCNSFVRRYRVVGLTCQRLLGRIRYISVRSGHGSQFFYPSASYAARRIISDVLSGFDNLSVVKVSETAVSLTVPP